MLHLNMYTTDLLRGLSDNRLLIENMPKVGHGGEAAISLGVDYKEYVLRFIGLEPKVFFICDGRLGEERNKHLRIGDGEYDFRFLMECIKRNVEKLVTIETPKGEVSLDEDMEKLYILNNMSRPI